MRSAFRQLYLGKINFCICCDIEVIGKDVQNRVGNNFGYCGIIKANGF
jgi:hypothetical protein